MWIFINLFFAALNLGLYLHSSDPSVLNLISGLLSLFVGIMIAIESQ